MKYKDGVILSIQKVMNGEIREINISPFVNNAILIVDDMSQQLFGKEIVVTSLLDGIHSKNSFHYTGLAFDIRTWIYKSKQIPGFVSKIKEQLGKNYDVILEEDHIHIEYDPKP